jgi:hypothetical protein
MMAEVAKVAGAGGTRFHAIVELSVYSGGYE